MIFADRKKRTEMSTTSPDQPSLSRSNKFFKNKRPKSTSISNILVHQINSESQRKFIDVELNDQPIKLQIDSGADVTIVSEMLCNEKNIDFSPTSLNPTSASGDQFPLIGEFSCDVTFGDETHFSTIYVSRNNSLNGNDLLTVFNLWDKPINQFCSDNVCFR